tara:strand:- start:124 stop:291 length:168 start_codon:yes stop_codon:yes gene_type:complete
MKVGDLITWFNPQLGGGYESFVGLIIDSDRKMIKVSFNGFKHPRWVSPTQCEVVA